MGPLRTTTLRPHLLIGLKEHQPMCPLTWSLRKAPEGSPTVLQRARPRALPSPGYSGHRLWAAEASMPSAGSMAFLREKLVVEVKGRGRVKLPISSVTDSNLFCPII